MIFSKHRFSRALRASKPSNVRVFGIPRAPAPLFGAYTMIVHIPELSATSDFEYVRIFYRQQFHDRYRLKKQQI
jgi:hypothetical protein